MIILYETPVAARARLIDHGYPDDVAAEIAVYLSQADDLSRYTGEIRAALAAVGIDAHFADLGDIAAVTASLAAAPDRQMLWCLTDGIRFYRGSAVPALARLLGASRFGAPPAAQHLCQDKFATLALAASCGLACPSTLLLEGTRTIARLGTTPWAAGPVFVKPNTLGAKIGITADSRCADRAAARAVAQHLWDRYGDRAVVQPFIAGNDVRVSYMDLGGPLREHLGIAELAPDPARETGAFLTMLDNQTLSGIDGAAAFTPRMIDLRARKEPPARRAVLEITEAADKFARLLGLTDYFSMDFRRDEAGQTSFLEFEVCPAVTIYDFQHYLQTTYGLTLGAALARAMPRAHARRQARAEA